jgi:hypothetical protein
VEVLDFQKLLCHVKNSPSITHSYIKPYLLNLILSILLGIDIFIVGAFTKKVNTREIGKEGVSPLKEE